MIEQALELNPETFIQPDIEGVRIVGRVDLSRIRDVPSTDNRAVWITPGEETPADLMPIQPTIHDFSESHPGEPINVTITKTEFSSDLADPFQARLLADMMEEPPIAPVHKDWESAFVSLVCDSNPTVFYPDDGTGGPDMNKAWQPKAGEVVEFTGTVWHSPPLHVEGEGTRTLITLRSGYREEVED